MTNGEEDRINHLLSEQEQTNKKFLEEINELKRKVIILERKLEYTRDEINAVSNRGIE